MTRTQTNGMVRGTRPQIDAPVTLTVSRGRAAENGGVAGGRKCRVAACIAYVHMNIYNIYYIYIYIYIQIYMYGRNGRVATALKHTRQRRGSASCGGDVRLTGRSAFSDGRFLRIEENVPGALRARRGTREYSGVRGVLGSTRARTGCSAAAAIGFTRAEWSLQWAEPITAACVRVSERVLPSTQYSSTPRALRRADRGGLRSGTCEYSRVTCTRVPIGYAASACWSTP